MKYILLLLFSSIAFGQAAKTIKNKAQDQDFCLEVNDGGVPTNGLCVVGSTGETSLKARTDGDVGIGNLVSGTFTSSVANSVNVSSITNQGCLYNRVGNVVNLTCRFVATLAGSGSGRAIGDLTGFPVSGFGTVDFTSSSQCIGSIVAINATAGDESFAGFVESNSSLESCRFYILNPNASSKSYIFAMNVQLQP